MIKSTEYHIIPEYPLRCIQGLVSDATLANILVFAEQTPEGGYILNFERSDEFLMQELCLNRGIIPNVH